MQNLPLHCEFKFIVFLISFKDILNSYHKFLHIIWLYRQVVHTSVDSEYLLNRVLTREYLFFDTF